MSKAPPHLSQPSQIIARIVAALIPGYLLTHTLCILVALLLSLMPTISKIAAVTSLSMLSFGIYAGIILWIFAVAALRTIWLYLSLAIIATALASWLLYLLEQYQ